MANDVQFYGRLDGITALIDAQGDVVGHEAAVRIKAHDDGLRQFHNCRMSPDGTLRLTDAQATMFRPGQRIVVTVRAATPEEEKAMVAENARDHEQHLEDRKGMPGMYALST